jgi:hypothetical protein
MSSAIFGDEATPDLGLAECASPAEKSRGASPPDGGAAPVTRIPGVVFVESSAGRFTPPTADGKALVQFDSALRIETVNGAGHGRQYQFRRCGGCQRYGTRAVGHSDLGNGARGNPASPRREVK